MQKAVTTVGRLPKTAAHVVLVQNQRERAAAMHGKALVFSALVLALGISTASAQSLFEQRERCQKYARDLYLMYSNQTQYTANLDIKLGHCYVLIYSSSSKFLYDAITKEDLAYISLDEKLNPKVCSVKSDDHLFVFKKCDIVEKFISDKMKSER